MVFKRVELEKPEREFWKFSKVGDSITGTYVELIRDFGVNKSLVYVLEVNGKNVYVWDSTTLNERMNHVKIGDVVQIVYLGKPGKYYKFDVLIDDGLPIETFPTEPQNTQ